MSKEKLINNKSHLMEAGAGSIKSLLSTLSWIGPAAIGAWDGYRGSRLNEFINELSERLNKLDEMKVDKDYIQSEEFYDLFHKALRTIASHRSKIKARFILGLIIESVRNDKDRDFTISQKESFITILDQLSDEEMKLLYNFCAGKYPNMTKDKFYEKAKGFEIDGLMAKGILAPGWDQRLRETALGKKFIDYMRILAKESISQ